MDGITFFYNWEVDLMASIQSLASPVLTSIMTAITMIGEEKLMILLLLFMYLCVDKKLGRTMTAGMLITLVGGAFLKNSFLRRRPYFDNPEIKCLRAPSGSGDPMNIAAQGYSFPSLHAANAVTVFGPLCAWFRKRWAKIAILVLIIASGLSRVYLGAHYPTDVLTGWLIGIIALAAVTLVLRRYSNWLVIFAVTAALALPGWFLCHTTEFYVGYGMMAGMFLAFHFDDKVVHFSNIPLSWRSLLRLLGGFAIFTVMGILLKLPFSREFLRSGSFAAHLVYVVRYAAASFAAVGLYPMLFKHTDRLFNRK